MDREVELDLERACADTFQAKDLGSGPQRDEIRAL